MPAQTARKLNYVSESTHSTHLIPPPIHGTGMSMLHLGWSFFTSATAHYFVVFEYGAKTDTCNIVLSLSVDSVS